MELSQRSCKVVYSLDAVLKCSQEEVGMGTIKQVLDNSEFKTFYRTEYSRRCYHTETNSTECALLTTESAEPSYHEKPVYLTIQKQSHFWAIFNINLLLTSTIHVFCSHFSQMNNTRSNIWSHITIFLAI